MLTKQRIHETFCQMKCNRIHKKWVHRSSRKNICVSCRFFLIWTKYSKEMSKYLFIYLNWTTKMKRGNRKKVVGKYLQFSSRNICLNKLVSCVIRRCLIGYLSQYFSCATLVSLDILSMYFGDVCVLVLRLFDDRIRLRFWICSPFKMKMIKLLWRNELRFLDLRSSYVFFQ